MRTVSRISMTPVKGFALLHPAQVDLTERGVVENRRFFLVDDEGRRLRSSLTDWPCRVQGEYDAEREVLRMQFPGGREVEGDARALGAEVACEFSGDLYAHPVTVLSEASVERLSREAGQDVDGRRFRMLFTLAGCEAHEEDEWEGRSVRLGEAVVRVEGPVDRCAATTRHPDTGERELDTLQLIKGYRGQAPDGSILFGVLGGIERAGRVRLGDPVEPL